MLTVYAATRYHDWINETIASEDRLGELVRVVDYLDEKPEPSAHSLVVKEDAVYSTLDWHDLLPPYLLPQKLEARSEYLLALLFARLNNYERVYFYLADLNPSLNQELDIVNRLQHGLTINPEDLISEYNEYDEYRLMHNHGVVRHYGVAEADHEQTKYYYLQALESAPTAEHRAYSARQFGSLLIDEGELEDAVRVLSIGLASAESDEAKTALRHTLCQARMQLLTVPYDQKLLKTLKEDLWTVLQAYEAQNRPLETALVLVDAGTIANYDESWSEGLGYLSKAITLLEDEEMPGLMADANLRKGILLYSWAQHDNPQFFRPAAEALQRAARTFSRDEAPLVYADIQNRLGLVYSEIPDEAKKKGMWAAVSSTAFQEALTIYTPEEHPYEYAMVCNHYGNALTKYPAAKLTDNTEKALFYYQEALAIRKAETMPLERSLTLLNYLEAQWNLGMPEDRFDLTRYNDMRSKAEEVIAISPDPKLIDEANIHLDKLGQLRAAYA